MQPSCMRTICAGLLCLFATVALADCPPNYSYEGFTQPSQWPYVAAGCGGSSQQSPIVIGQPLIGAKDGPIAVSYQDALVTVTLANSGHDFRVIPPPSPAPQNTITARGIAAATLDNFHFHSPAEHMIPGYGRLAGEIHFVHKNASGTVVIAVLLTSSSSDNTTLQPILGQLPIRLCGSRTPAFNFRSLFGSSIPEYYRYVGSLTTPGCDPNITFLVVPTPWPISMSQLALLTAFGQNARPLQERIPGTTITNVTP